MRAPPPGGNLRYCRAAGQSWQVRGGRVELANSAGTANPTEALLQKPCGAAGCLYANETTVCLLSDR